MTVVTPPFEAPLLADPRLVEEPPLVSVVLPVYNEVAALPRLVQQLDEVFQSTGCRSEFVFADDGSTDGSAAWLKDMARARHDLNVVVLTRNFGQQAALQAGLEEARGDAVIVMDSDLQDDPSAIPRFLEMWRAGYDVVYAIRMQRRENWLKRSLFFGFYRVLRMLADVPIPADAGNFGLLDRRVLNHLQALPERTRFFPGLRSWVGFRQIGIPVARLSRYDDTPRVSFWQLVRLAKTAIFSFSSTPIMVFWMLALLSGGVFLFGGLVAIASLWMGRSLPTITNTVLTTAFFATLNATAVAVLGEYIVRILDQVQGRPAYLVDHVVRAESRQSRPRNRRPRTVRR